MTEETNNLYCAKCGKLIASIGDKESGGMIWGISPEYMRCRDCMKKEFGEGFLDYVENNAEIIDDDNDETD
jgi:phage FluMu protein Com